MLVLLRVAGLPATSTTPSPAFLISMILIIVAQAYPWLCSGWVLPVLWTRVSSQRPNGPPPNNFGYDHTWRAPGTRVSGEEYREFTGQPLTLPVDERAPLAGVVSAHCSTSPPGRHCRGLVSRGERAPSGATDVDRHFGQLVSDHPLVAASVHSQIRVCSVHIVNGSVYNYEGNEGTMYSAPSPYDEPTKPIDVQTLRARWVHQRNETQVIEPRKPNRVASIDQK